MAETSSSYNHHSKHIAIVLTMSLTPGKAAHTHPSELPQPHPLSLRLLTASENPAEVPRPVAELQFYSGSPNMGTTLGESPAPSWPIFPNHYLNGSFWRAQFKLYRHFPSSLFSEHHLDTTDRGEVYFQKIMFQVTLYALISNPCFSLNISTFLKSGCETDS